MAATRIIEEERGAYVGFLHSHNGYYAGDFSRRAVRTSTVPRTHPVVPIPAMPFVDHPSRGAASSRRHAIPAWFSADITESSSTWSSS